MSKPAGAPALVRPHGLGPAASVLPLEASLHGREWSAGAAGQDQLFLMLSRRGVLVTSHGAAAFASPALVWMPGLSGAKLRLEAGARGDRIMLASRFVADAVSGSPEGGRVQRFLAKAALVGADRLLPFSEEVRHSARALSREITGPARGSAGIVAAHVSLLCLHVWRLAEPGPDRDRATERAASVAQRFAELVEQHLREGWSIGRYAKALGVTEDRLNAAVVRRFGKPPSLLLRERLVAEVRSRLQGTDGPVAQIAFALGFRDPAYFSRFCNKHLGVPPGRYRRETLGPGPRPEPPSYAAWP